MRTLLFICAALTSFNLMSCEHIARAMQYLQICATCAIHEHRDARRTIELNSSDQFYKKHPHATEDISGVIRMLNFNNNQGTIDDALIAAAIQKFNGLLNLLVTSMTSETATPKRFEIPLLWACQASNEEGALLLLEKTEVSGIAKTADGQTPLSLAHQHHLASVISKLEEKQFELKSFE